MAKQLILLGGGGHGKVLLDTLLRSDMPVSGILDLQLRVGDRVFGVPVLGGDELLDANNPPDVLLVNGLGANPNTSRRSNIYSTLKIRGFEFQSVRHVSAIAG